MSNLKEADIFSIARGIESSETRRAYLDQACDGNPALRARVEALLAEAPKLGDFLESPSPEATRTEIMQVTEVPGNLIGNYKLMEQIGEGGMGVVYVAEQERPVRRKVALKIIKPGMDTKEVIARFEAERQALALMNHPNIARVLDAGCTESARPYFVMELVNGIPITEYCDRYSLSTNDRLKLFTSICKAVQHAHQKGIIHRDLKPSNVLVTEHDGTPVPKIIDFGVAKAINQRLTERTVYTRFQQMVGTPMYMSPEQAELSGLDVDTRTDIYSLGVLLYKLLTGTTPFDEKRFNEAAYDEMRRIIREEEPAKPSTRISSLGDTATSISARRGTDIGKLHRLLRGDLDWIVMKAMEKDRSRRYESANGFARDLERFLQDEPVEARSPSVSYRFRKFARRNKAAIASVSAVSLALMVGLCLTTVGFVSARSQRDIAEGLARENEKRRGEAEHARDVAQRQRRRTVDALAEAEKQKILAENNQLKAEYVGYVSQIHAAAASLSQDNTMVARETSLHTAGEALLATMPKYRNWEWGYLVGKTWPPLSHRDADAILSREPSVSVSEFWSNASASTIVEFDHGDLRSIGDIRFNNDGTRIVTAPTDGTVHIWDARTGDSLGSFQAGPALVAAVAFSHDDSLIATGGSGGDIAIFDSKPPHDKPWVPRAAENAKSVSALWFSRDDSRLVSAHFDGVVRVWETDSGREVTSYRKHGELVRSLRFLADDQTVVSASRDGWVRVWELDTGRDVEPARRAPRWEGLSMQVISPNTREVAAGYFDGSTVIWDRETGQKLRDLSQGSEGIEYLLYSRDGTSLLAAEGERSVSVLDTASGEQVAALAGPLWVRAQLALSPQGDRVVTISRVGTCKVWAPVVSAAEEPIKMSSGHEDAVLQAAFSFDGKRVVTASYDGTAKVWDAVTQELITTFTGHEHELLKAEFSPDGQWVASVSSRGTVRVWDAETAEEVFSVAADPESFFRAASSERGLRGNILNFSAVFSSSPFTQSTSKLVVNEGQEMAVVDSRNWKELLRLEGSRVVGWPVIGPFDKHVAVVTDTLHEVHLWELDTGRKLFPLRGHDRQAFFVEFSRDGSRLVTGSMDKTAIVWDARNGEEQFRIEGDGVMMVARFSPDGKRVATAAAGVSEVWDASIGKRLSTFSGHASRITNVEFSPDGTRILSTSNDMTVRIWDPKEPDARELVRLTGESKLLYGTWSPDGHQVLTCWGDGSVRLFEAFPWEQLVDADGDSKAMDERVQLWREGRSMR